MNSKQAKTLGVIFARPVPAAIAWGDIESLLLAVRCRLVEGAGSRVTFVWNGQVENFHRPHPAKEAKRYQVRQAREFLEKMGVQP